MALSISPPRAQPFIVFCHEWLQIGSGTICSLPLSEDLRAPAGEPVTLFSAADPSWALPDQASYVTDGPFLHRCQNGELLMLWSSFAGAYLEAVSRSRSGELTGVWEHDHLLFEEDGGHGMLFYGLSGQLYIALHQPNAAPLERRAFTRCWRRRRTAEPFSAWERCCSAHKKRQLTPERLIAYTNVQR